MSGDKLLQWTSPLPSASGNSAKKMEVMEFRRSRDSGIHCIIMRARADLLMFLALFRSFKGVESRPFVDAQKE